MARHEPRADMPGYGTAGAPTMMTRTEAQEITRAITSRAEEMWDLITLAYQRRADMALGYDSWDAYCEGEFASARIRVPMEERPEVVLSLSSAGLSTRAVASAMGTSAGTVRRDLAEGAGDGTAGSSVDASRSTGGTVTGLDGRRHPRVHRRTDRTPRPPASLDTSTQGVRDRIAARALARGVPGGASWALLDAALVRFTQDPEPTSALPADVRERLARNLAAVQEMLSS